MKPEYLCEMAIAEWGSDMQMDLFVEECAEAIKAVCKFRRYGKPQDLLNMAEEVADVEIMCESMRLIVGSEKVDKYKEEKLLRLKSMLLKETP